MSTNNIDQSEDFLAFTLDGQSIEFDLYEVFDSMSAIDRRHMGDLHLCNKCGTEFPTNPEGGELQCPGPECHSKDVRVDQSFLDDVAAYLVGRGFARCGRRAAGAFYQRVVDIRSGLKKNTALTPESPIGSELTPLAGLPDESGLS